MLTYFPYYPSAGIRRANIRMDNSERDSRKRQGEEADRIRLAFKKSITKGEYLSLNLTKIIRLKCLDFSPNVF
jgi:hypothetical protein